MSHAPDMSMPHAGDILGGRYVLVDRIGAGGMGRVFRARDEVLRRDVAVKIFFADRTDEAEPARRMSEARALAALDHPSLVTLYDARLDTGDHVYLVMELIDGPSLQRRIEQGPVATAEVAGILSDLAGALAVVHDAGIVHRDVKPSNVLLRPTRGTDRGFEAVLADFGVAHLVDATRLTTPGTVIGTAAYLAPEQVRGEPPRAASDVYALGLLAIEALTRLHPFGGGSLQETLLARLARQPDVPTTLGYAWRSLLVAMTANDPDVRPTAADVSERASALADGLGGTALETGPVTVTVASPWAQLGLADTGDAVAARADTPTAVVAAPVSGLTEASSPARSAASPADPAASSGSVTAASMIAVEEDRPATPADAATASAPTESPAPGAGACDVDVTAGATPGVDATDALSASPVAPPVESSTVPAVSPALATGDHAPRALGDAASPRADVVSRRSRAASAAVPSRRRRRRWVMGAAAAAVVLVGVHVVAFALGAAGDPYTTVGVPDPGPSVAASTPTPAPTPVAPSDDRASNVEQVSTRNDEATTIAEEAPVDGVPAHPTPVDGAPDDLLPAEPRASASNPGVANGTAGKASTGTGNGGTGSSGTGNAGTGNAGNGNGKAGGANVGNGNGNGGGAAPGRSADSGKGANGSGNAGSGPSGKDGAPGKK